MSQKQKVPPTALLVIVIALAFLVATRMVVEHFNDLSVKKSEAPYLVLKGGGKVTDAERALLKHVAESETMRKELAARLGVTEKEIKEVILDNKKGDSQ